MKYMQEFTNLILTSNEEFYLPNKENCEYYIFQRKIENIKYVYGINIEKDMYNTNDMYLIAVVKNEKIILIDNIHSYFIKSIIPEDYELPSNISYYSEEIKAMCKTGEKIFMELYDALEPKDIIDVNLLAECKEKARIKVLSGDNWNWDDYEVRSLISNAINDTTRILKLLFEIDKETMTEFVASVFRENKDFLLTKRSIKVKVDEYANNATILFDWEQKIKEAIGEIKESLNVEFTINGNSISLHMRPCYLLSSMARRKVLTYEDFDLVNNPRKLLKDFREANKINGVTCEDISQIAYNGKVIYKKA